MPSLDRILAIWPFRVAGQTPHFTVENTIGPGTSVHGEMKGPSGFRIDGTLQGSVDAVGPVVIGEGGLVDGDVSGRDVVVLGRVRGNVHASGHLEIGPRGKVVGDITVKSFRLQKGGVFRGTSRMAGGEDDEIFRLLPQRSGKRIRTLPPPAGAVPPPPETHETHKAQVSHDRLVTAEDLVPDSGDAPRIATR